MRRRQTSRNNARCVIIEICKAPPPPAATSHALTRQSLIAPLVVQASASTRLCARIASKFSVLPPSRRLPPPSSSRHLPLLLLLLLLLPVPPPRQPDSCSFTSSASSQRSRTRRSYARASRTLTGRQSRKAS